MLLRNGLAGSTFEFREAGTAYLVAKIAPRIFGKAKSFAQTLVKSAGRGWRPSLFVGCQYCQFTVTLPMPLVGTR